MLLPSKEEDKSKTKRTLKSKNIFGIRRENEIDIEVFKKYSDVHEFGKIEITIQKADQDSNRQNQEPSVFSSQDEEIKQSERTEHDF